MDMEQARINMLKQQIRTWGVTDEELLARLASTSREDFVPDAYRECAFADSAIPLGHGQMMLTPSVEARLLQALQLTSEDKVLEIGTGSGYLTALLAKSASHVYSMDIEATFTEEAQRKLVNHQITNVTLQTGDASAGWEQHAPFDAIVVTASLPYLPKALAQQLTVGGRLFAILGQAPTMEATLLTRQAQDTWQQQTLFETVTPPLANAPQLEKFTF